MAYDTGLGLVQQQVQKLVMTPELQQAIKLLQLPTVELSNYREEQLLQNPLLEVEIDDAYASADQCQGDPTEADVASGASADARSADEPVVDWAQYFGELGDGSWEIRGNDWRDEDPVAGIGWEPGLLESLRIQLKTAISCPRDQRIGEYLLGCLDNRGYLAVTVDEIAAALNVDVDEVEAVRRVLLNLEPVGIGSRDLQECLSAQIRAMQLDEDLSRLALQVVAAHLEDIAAGKLGKAASATGAPLARVQEAVDLIRRLNHAPGAGLSGDGEVRYITPDVYIERVDGEYIVIPNDSAVPRLCVSARYRALLTNPGVDATVKDFVRDRLNSALWLLRALSQRRDTILRVAESIVRRQKAFFDNGIMSLQPMTLKDVAADIGVHESTVSRATSGKYAQTPRGMFELKFFFSSGLKAADGQQAAAESVRRLIKQLIDEEDPSEPLSDRAIAERLQHEGIHVSRRTVAKYREEMLIPASAARRRY